jgi:hypothetical protein
MILCLFVRKFSCYCVFLHGIGAKASACIDVATPPHARQPGCLCYLAVARSNLGDAKSSIGFQPVLTSPRHYTPDRQDAYATLLSPDEPRRRQK